MGKVPGLPQMSAVRVEGKKADLDANAIQLLSEVTDHYQYQSILFWSLDIESTTLSIDCFSSRFNTSI